jgi:hypothetical protein
MAVIRLLVMYCKTGVRPVTEAAEEHKTIQKWQSTKENT